MANKSVALAVLGLLAVAPACKFNNPYQYLHKDCSDDPAFCKGGLDCLDGRCDWPTCEEDADCAERLECRGGRCMPTWGELADDGGEDDVGGEGDVGGGGDGSVQDGGGGEDVDIVDVGHNDTGAGDTAGQDTTGPADIVVVGDAPAVDHVSVDTGRDAGAADVVVTECHEDGDCGAFPWVCNPTIRTCLLPPGQRGEICNVGSSWCGGDGLNLECACPWQGEVGVCLPTCSTQDDCGSDGLCLSFGSEGGYGLGGVGHCYERCGGETAREPTSPLQTVWSCSDPSGDSSAPSGVWMPLQPEIMGIPCDGQNGGGSFLCAAKIADPTQRSLKLEPEALAWQALGVWNILLDENGRCPNGLFRATVNDEDVCMPRCRSAEDCSIVLPENQQAECYHAVEEGAGLCSGNKGGNCWLDGYEYSPTTHLCSPGSADPDGDGFPEWDDCGEEASLTSGCIEQGMCRVDQDCFGGTRNRCVVGTCFGLIGSCKIHCGPGETPFTTTTCSDANHLCLPQALFPEHLANRVCVNTGDCSDDQICISNVCYPKVGQPEDCGGGEFFHRTCLHRQQEPQGPIFCAAEADCPSFMRCDREDRVCRSIRNPSNWLCHSDTDCRSGESCLLGLCLAGYSSTSCVGEKYASACLSPWALDALGSFWTPAGPVGEDGGCPDGLGRGGTDPTFCFAPRSLCAPGGICPENQSCVGNRCLPDLPEPCGLGSQRVGEPGSEQCTSCVDAAGTYQSWDLDCLLPETDRESCPCGLMCMPDPDGRGVCAAPLSPMECVMVPGTGDRAYWCGSNRVATGGGPCQEVVKWAPCDFCQEMGMTCAYAPGGDGLCVSQELYSTDCSGAGTPCDARGLSGTCVEGGGDLYCVPAVVFSLYQPDPLLCNETAGLLAGCGPGCVCVEDSNQNMVPVPLEPISCADGSGFGGICPDYSSLPVETGEDGMLCSAGTLPGRVVSNDAGNKICVPTGALPAPGCEGTSCDDRAGRCFGGGCYSSCENSGSCGSMGECILPEDSPHKICRPRPAQNAILPCDPYSFRCKLDDQEEGGVCVPDGDGSTCFPRVGCDMKTVDEVCVDGAPIPTPESKRLRCMPWTETRCAIYPLTCGMGLCHVNGRSDGVCTAPTECNHWLECRPGELCQGGRCVGYLAQGAPLSICDTSFYGPGHDGLVFDSAMGSRCHLKLDPRCAARGQGESCTLLEKRGDDHATPHVCTSDQACVPFGKLDFCNPDSGSCSTGGADGVCLPFEGPGDGRCVP